VRFSGARGLFLLLALSAAGCRRESPPTPEPARRADDTAAARGLPTNADAAPPASLEGSLAVGHRPIDFGVYLPATAPQMLLDSARAATKKRVPDLPLQEKPGAAPPPFVVVFAPPIADVPPPSPDQIRLFGRGLDDAQAASAAASQGVLAFAFILDGDPKLARLHATQQLALEVARPAGGFIWDEETRELFTPTRWQAQRVDGWEGDLPTVVQHIVIHYYATDGGKHRAITLGMVKFGLPDLVVDDVPLNESDDMSTIVDCAAQLLVEGATLGKNGRLTIDLSAIRQTGAKKAILARVRSGAKRLGQVELALTTPEEGDPDNRLVVLRFPMYPGATAGERQAAAIAGIVGG
jgi:hypothetical protein